MARCRSVMALFAAGPPAVVLLAASCAGRPPAGRPAAGGGIDAARLYLTCAGSCHRPEPVKNYPASEWARILPEMAQEARLSPEKTEALRLWIDRQIVDR